MNEQRTNCTKNSAVRKSHIETNRANCWNYFINLRWLKKTIGGDKAPLPEYMGLATD